MSNIYYNPEEFGLELVKSLDEPNMSYEFNMFAIWRRLEDGALFYGSDSGCSCPSPFEDVTGLSQLSEIRYMKAFEQELRSWGGSYFDAQTLQDVVDKINVIYMYKCRYLDK